RRSDAFIRSPIRLQSIGSPSSVKLRRPTTSPLSDATTFSELRKSSKRQTGLNLSVCSNPRQDAGHSLASAPDHARHIVENGVRVVLLLEQLDVCVEQVSLRD